MTLAKMAVGVFVGLAMLTACTNTPTTSSPPSTRPSASGTTTEAPVAVETNPPGDIPDNQVYVAYRSSAGHFTVQIPEGWARTTTTSGASFTDKLNIVSASWRAASSAPTPDSVRRDDVPGLKSQRRAFQFVGIRSVTLNAGAAVLLTFRENSEPNSVTGKQYRDDVQWYALYHAGTEVVLELTSPVGADNVDPWRTISQSLRWA